MARFPEGRYGLCVLAAALLMLSLAGCRSQRAGFPESQLKPADADVTFEKGRDLPPSANTLYAMARLFASQGHDAEAEATLLRIVREHPGFMPAYCDLAEVHVRHRRIQSAIEALSAGLDVAPQDAVLHNNLGMCWVLKGDYARALDSFTAAAGAMPHDARYRANMALALGLLGRDEECLTLYSQVLSEPEARHNLKLLGGVRRDGSRAAAQAAAAVTQTGSLAK